MHPQLPLPLFREKPHGSSASTQIICTTRDVAAKPRSQNIHRNLLDTSDSNKNSIDRIWIMAWHLPSPAFTCCSIEMLFFCLFHCNSKDDGDSKSTNTNSNPRLAA